MMYDFYYEENEKLSDTISSILSLLERIDNVEPDSYSLILLTIHLSELTKLLQVKPITYYAEMSIRHVRQLPNITNNLYKISQSVICVQKKEDGYYEPSRLDEWYINRYGSILDEDCNVIEEWKPTPLESEIMHHIDSYSSFNRKVVKDLTVTYYKVVDSFMKECDLYLNSINFDNILLQVYAQYKEAYYDSIIDNIKTWVSKSCKKIKASTDDYQEYLFDYLKRLSDEGKDEPAKKCIYDAHIIGQPLCITDRSIKYYLLNEDSDVNEGSFRRIMSTIISFNFIKEKCGDIISEQGEGNTLRDKAKREPAILFTPKAMKLWEKLQDAGYIDAEFQPIKPKISGYKATVVAAILGSVLELNPCWAPFEQLWHMNNMSSQFDTAKKRNYYSKLQNTIIELLVDKP